MVSIHDRLGVILFVVPEDSNLVAAEHGKFISRVGIAEPRAKMFLVSERLDIWCLIFIVDSSFSAKSIDIRELVYAQYMFLV